MKYLKIALYAVLMLFVGVFFTSCDKSIMDEPMAPQQKEQLQDELTFRTSQSLNLLSVWGVDNTDPLAGSNLLFFAQVNGQTTLPGGIKLKLYYHGWHDVENGENAENPEYVDMLWNDQVRAYYCNKRIDFMGKISFRFVRGDNVDENLTPQNREIRIHGTINLNVDGVSNLYWPFGWDGSTNSNRGSWYASRLTHPTGPSAENEYYAQDWNWGSGSDDLGRKVCSPISGVVTSTGWGPSTYGNRVDVESTIDGKTVRVRFAHLNQILVEEGDFVGPNTIIGTIGNSGGNFSPHLHLAFNLISPSDEAKSLEYNFEQ